MLSIFNLSGGTAQSGRSHCSIQAEPLLNFAGRADFAERRTQLAELNRQKDKKGRPYHFALTTWDEEGIALPPDAA